jgi:hypothetical protein
VAATGALATPANVPSASLAPAPTPSTPFTPPAYGSQPPPSSTGGSQQPRASAVMMHSMLAASKFKALTPKGPPKRPDPLRSVQKRGETPPATPMRNSPSPSVRANESPGPKLTPGQKTIVRRNADTPVKSDKEVLAEFGGFLDRPLGFFGFTVGDKRKAILTMSCLAFFLVILFIILAVQSTTDDSSSSQPPWPACTTTSPSVPVPS